MKVQVAVEYIIIVAVVIAFLVPLWSYVASVKQQTGEQLRISYAQNAVDKIADTADMVYSQGPPAKVNLRVYIPGGVGSTNISGTMVNMKVWVGMNYSDVTAFSMVQMNGTLPSSEGNYWVTVEAREGFVQIDTLH